MAESDDDDVDYDEMVASKVVEKKVRLPDPPPFQLACYEIELTQGSTSSATSHAALRGCLQGQKSG